MAYSMADMTADQMASWKAVLLAASMVDLLVASMELLRADQRADEWDTLSVDLLVDSTVVWMAVLTAALKADSTEESSGGLRAAQKAVSTVDWTAGPTG